MDISKIFAWATSYIIVQQVAASSVTALVFRKAVDEETTRNGAVGNLKDRLTVSGENT